LLPAASNRLFVGNLSYNTTAEGLGKHFAQLDGFLAANVAFDPRRQASRGFGFVEFESVEAAQRAREVGGGSASRGGAAASGKRREHGS
jgi:RNA recognition motif-containing protein